jgi:hypothetical protein
MPQNTPWSFYGRRTELQQMQRILERRRWFFMQISGRRRIGKTALIQQALQGAGIARTLYVQIPDSDPAGVLIPSPIAWPNLVVRSRRPSRPRHSTTW